MAGSTDHYGLTTLGAGESFAEQGYKFTDADRHKTDGLLYLGAEAHVHDGATGSIEEPEDGLQLTLNLTGGTLPSGTRIFYKWTFINSRGEESIASPEVFVDTPDAISEPGAPGISYSTTGGTLQAGNYFYVLSAYVGASIAETQALSPVYITIPATTVTNEITLDLPDTPVGADGFNVYRRMPGQAKYFFLASVATNVATPPTVYVDDGSVEDDCDRTLPRVNTTNSTNSVDIELPTSVPSVPTGYTWRIYRTFVDADWSRSLLTTVVEFTNEATPVVTTTYTDVGISTSDGQPPTQSMVTNSPSKILLTGGAEVQGLLPATMIDGGVGGALSVLLAGSDATQDQKDAADFECDGTNDEVQFQAAVDGLNADGGIIEVVGTLQFQAVVNITIPYNVVIRGAGVSDGWGPNGAIKRTGGTGALFNLATGVTFEQIYLADEGTSGRTTSLILNDGGLTLDRCYLQSDQPTGHFIEAEISSNIIVDACYINMSNASSGNFINATSSGCSGVVIRDCQSFQVRNGYLVDFNDTSASLSPEPEILVEHCTTRSNSRLSAGLVRVNSPNGARVFVLDNEISTAQSIGVDLTDGVPTIVGNTFGRQGNPTTNLGTTAIKLTSCDSGGIISNNTILHAGHHGVWLLDSSDIEVTGNVIRSYGRTTTTTYSGVIVDGNSDRNSITHNQFRKAGSGNVPLYGVRIDDSTCNDNFIKDNDIFNASASNGNEVSDAGTGTRGHDVLLFSLGDETTAIASTGQKLAVRAPFNFVLTGARGSLNSASASGGPFTIDVEEGGTSVFTTDLLEIDDGELTSVTAATQPNITDHYLAEDALITFDVDDVGDGAATGAKVALYGWRV